MSIQDIVIKIKGRVGEENLCKIRLFLPFGVLGISLLLIILTGFISGRVIERRKNPHQKPPITIELPPLLEPYTSSYAPVVQSVERFEAQATINSTTRKEGTTTMPPNGNTASFVTSKTGKVYYPVTCKSVNRIKPENRVYYESSSELIARGYTLSKTC